MKNVIIFTEKAVGSVLALAEEIKLSYNIEIIIIILNGDKEVKFVLQASKFIDEIVNINYSDSNDFLYNMKKWTLQKGFLQKPIVFFATDSSCYIVNINRSWFEKHYELVLPSSNIVTTYTQKGRAEKDAQNNGLLIPRSEVIKDEADANFIYNNFDFPVIIKPISSYDSNKAPFKTIKLCKDVFYETQIKLIEQGYEVICQEFIPGDDSKSFFYLFHRTRRGEVFYVLGRKVIQCPPEAGIMAKGIVEENQVLNEICTNFLNKIDYKGIGGIEFKEFNGKFYFIEMSTRLEGFFKIASLANLPLGKIAYEDLSNMNYKDNYNIKIGTEYIDFVPLVVTYQQKRKYGLLLRDLILLLFFNKRKLNIYSKNSGTPFYVSIFSLLKKAIK